VVRFLVRLLITGAAVLGVSYFSNGALLKVDSLLWAVVFALVLCVLNATIRPVLQLIALPFSILTLGIVALLINLGVFYLAAALTGGNVQTVGFWPTVGAAIIISVFNSLAAWITERRD
jgi:putative membrane protein